MNPPFQKAEIPETIFIEGKMYDNLQFSNGQGTQTKNYNGNLLRNRNEQFIIKEYNQISNNDKELLQQIKTLQNEKIPKCQKIIKIYGIQDITTSQGQKKFYIVEEKGKDIQTLMYSRPSISSVEKCRIFEQMVEGVIQLHQLGYFLRDLKPDFFVYFENKNKNYTVKLIDLGFEEKGIPAFSVQPQGTFNYMAPEVMLQQMIYDKTADIWSLGIILYQLLTSQDFFQTKNKNELLEQMNDLAQEQINNRINDTLDLGQLEKDVISSMLQKERKNRICLEKLLYQCFPKIKEQEESKEKIKLEQEKEQYLSQSKIVQEQCSLYSPQIQINQQHLNFYKHVYKSFLGQDKISEMIIQNQKITKDINSVEEEEKSMSQLDSLQQITLYQYCSSKLEKIKLDQDKLKNLIEEANYYIYQIDNHYIDQHHQEIENLNKQLSQYLEELKQFNQYLFYNQITQISQLIQNNQAYLNYLMQLIQLRMSVKYQEYKRIYKEIKENVGRNVERIKNLQYAQYQLNQFVKKMKDQQSEIQLYLDNNQCYKNEYNTDLINDTFKKINQIILDQQKTFEQFNQFNEFNSSEKINNQIQSCESFKAHLIDLEKKKIIYIGILKSKLIVYHEMVQKNKILNNQLENKHNQFSSALQSINFQVQSIELYKQMNEKKEKLNNQLEQEITTLEEYLKLQHQNAQLFNQELKDLQIIQSEKKKQTRDLIEKNQKTNQINAQRLEIVFKRVKEKQKELNFSLLDDNLIKNYEQLKMQEEQLQIELYQINEKSQNQQLNHEQLTELIKQINNMSAKIDDQMKKIPQNNEIQLFNQTYQQNLELYEKLYALVIYIKQYHVTRYNERIKERKNKNKQEVASQIQNEDQGLLSKYEIFLFKNLNKMTIEDMENDLIKTEDQLKNLENDISIRNLVKLRPNVKDQQMLKEIEQFFKVKEFAQMIISQIMKKKNRQIIPQEQSN